MAIFCAWYHSRCVRFKKNEAFRLSIAGEIGTDMYRYIDIRVLFSFLLITSYSAHRIPSHHKKERENSFGGILIT